MAQRVFAFYADKYTDAEWSNDFGGYTQRFIATRDAYQLACAAVGVPLSEAILISYRYGINEEQDKQLSLKSLGVSQIPQLLFAMLDPSLSEEDFLQNGGGAIFVAKLVQGQITRKNIEIMLKTCRSLQYRIDPTSGQPSFYDPTFRLFGDLSIGFNPASAPGGSVIGLGLQERLTLNRTGQVLDNIFSLLKKLLPFAVVGGIYYVSQKKRK